MTPSHRNLLPLWDYGWCEHERMTLPACLSPQGFIFTYRQSDAFGTGFIHPQPIHSPEIHGPFSRSLISGTDFELITRQRFLETIAAIPHTTGFTEIPSAAQWQAVERLVFEASSRHRWLFMLNFTEDDRECFHQWGDVFMLFREFVCASPGCEFAERLVFGYD